MIPDKLLINLKIISKIQKNGRIARSYDGIISLESDTVYQPLKRFLSSDSRKQAIFEINSIVSECLDTISYVLNSKYMNINYANTDEYFKNCESLNLIVSAMDSARVGIENLKFTYQNDQNIVTQLDIIILKLQTTIRDTSQKLYYYQSHIPYSAHRQFFTFARNAAIPIHPPQDAEAMYMMETPPTSTPPQQHEINMENVDTGSGASDI